MAQTPFPKLVLVGTSILLASMIGINAAAPLLSDKRPETHFRPPTPHPSSIYPFHPYPSYVPGTSYYFTPTPPPSVYPPTFYTNVALYKPVVQSHGQVVYKDYEYIYPPYNITDGDYTTFWRNQTDSAGDSRGQAVIDLLDSYYIRQILFKVDWDNKPQYDDEIAVRISYSDDAYADIDSPSDWTAISEVILGYDQFGEIQTTDLYGKPISARYIKIEYINEDEMWAGWGNIFEVEVFGEKL